MAGWTLTEDYLESKISPTTNNNIRIQADGNIGCYGHGAETRTEACYTIRVENNFEAIWLNSKDPKHTKDTIHLLDTIYPFVSIIGKTKTQRVVSGDYDKTYDQPTEEYMPSPPSSIQFAFVEDG